MTVTTKNKDRVLRQFNFSKVWDERVICVSLEKQIKADEFEKANEILKYGWDVRQAVHNYLHLEANKKYGFIDFVRDENGWQKPPKWINVEVVELLGWGNSFEIGQGLNGKWTYGYKASHNIGGAYCGLNEFLEPLPSRGEAIKVAISEIVNFHNKAIAEKGLEEAAKNTSRKVLAKIKEYQKPKQAVLF